MILESRIIDESKVTFDCAKATIEKGSKISIDDSFYKFEEIQNAIKMGLVALIGPAPVLPEENAALPERKVRFRNTYITKLCFECLKDYADPNMILHVPVSKLDELEIRNAISAGWIVNEDEPPTTPLGRSTPVHLEELTAADIITAPQPKAEAMKSNDLPEGIPATRPVKGKKQAVIKAKKISSKNEDNDDEDNELFKESEVVMPKQAASKKQQPTPSLMPVETDEGEYDDDLDFSNIFSGNQPKKK